MIRSFHLDICTGLLNLTLRHYSTHTIEFYRIKFTILWPDSGKQHSILFCKKNDADVAD